MGHRLFPVLLFFLFLVGGITPARAGGEIVVIVHPSNPTSSLTSIQVSHLYLGRSRVFPHGGEAEVIDQGGGGIRERFFKLLNGMTLSQVNAYWARLMFSGRVLSPRIREDNQAVIQFVSSHPLAIGYVEGESLDPSVREVLRLHE